MPKQAPAEDLSKLRTGRFSDIEIDQRRCFRIRMNEVWDRLERRRVEFGMESFRQPCLGVVE